MGKTNISLSCFDPNTLRQIFLEIVWQNWPFKIGLSLFDFKQFLVDSGSIVQCTRYECGLAKKFLDPNSGELYKELQISCNWNRTWSSVESSNRTWTPEDGLHACVWVQCMNPPEVVSHKLSFKQSPFFIFSLLENSTSSPTGREAQLSSLKAWTSLALVQSSILKRTSTNLLGKELVASPMAPGNSWSPGLPVLKVNFNILITDQYSPLSRCQLHISSTWASRTDALGRKSGIWCACQSVQLFHVNGQVLKHYLPPLCLPIRIYC